MIIRCPQCEHTRSLNESKIPPTAELATCPKCKHRFRFRTLHHSLDSAEAPGNGRPAPTARPSARPPAQEVIRPQSAVRESAEQKDIWDAVDALHERWQAQLDLHVTEVEHPGLSQKHDEAKPAPPVEAKAHDSGERQAPTAPARHVTAEPPHAAAPSAARENDAQGALSAIGLAELSAAPAGGGGSPVKIALEDARAPAHASTHIPTQGIRHSPATPPPHPENPATAQKLQPAETAEPADNGAAVPRQDTPVIFPYANEGAKPEERVEHSLRMLRQETPSRPLRDLGRLREFPDSESDEENAKEPGGEIPWENPARYGWVKGFMGTVRGVMFNAPGIFSAINPVGSLAPGYLFFLTLGYISIIATVVWGHVTALLLPGVLSPLGAPVALPVLLLLAPVALGLMLLFVTGLIRIFVSLLAPEKASFPLIYRIVSYSVAPFILSIVPFVGPGLGALWFLATLILGCRHGLGLSWGLAVIAPLFPATALLGGLFWYFL